MSPFLHLVLNPVSSPAVLHDLLLSFIVFITALIAGTVDTIAGGGGLICLPVLLLLGLSPQTALGTNKLQACFGAGTASYSFYRSGQISSTNPELLLGILITLLGASLGTLSIIFLSASFIKKIIPYLLLVALIYILFTPQKYLHQTKKPKLNKIIFLIIFGLILGFYDGFFGPGTGSFWAVLIMIFLGLNLKQATMHAKIFNFSSNLAALFWFISFGHINYFIGCVMGIGQALGAILGSQLVLKQGVKLIKPVFILMVSVMIGILLKT